MFKMIEPQPALATNTDLAPSQEQSRPANQETAAEETTNTDQAPTNQGQSAIQGAKAAKDEQTQSFVDSAHEKKPTPANIVLRNQRNAKRLTGPHYTKRTRHNALRHGLRASGLTRFDDTEEYLALVEELTSVFEPRNGLEKFLVENLARDIVRHGRATRMEADSIELLSNRSASTDQEPGSTPAMLEPMMVTEYPGLLDLPLRYGTAIMNQVLRLKRELERGRDEDRSGPSDERTGNGDLIN